MSDIRNIVPGLHEPRGAFNARVDYSALALRGVVIGLTVLAMIGAVKGLVSMRQGLPGSSLLDPSALVQGEVVQASPIAPLAHDPEWSVLKGPQILTPPPQRTAAADDEAASDDAPDQDNAAADAPEAETAQDQPEPPVTDRAARGVQEPPNAPPSAPNF